MLCQIYILRSCVCPYIQIFAEVFIASSSPSKQKKEVAISEPEIQPEELISEPLTESPSEIVTETEAPASEEVIISDQPKEPSPQVHKVEHIETTYTKVQGPKIMGKIDLPVVKVKEKEPVKRESVSPEISDVNKKNKKRKKMGNWSCRNNLKAVNVLNDCDNTFPRN